MDKADRYGNIITRAALSCGSFTSAYSVAILPFFAAYCALNAHIAVTACIALACLIPFAVMPLAYWLMHRFSPLLFGRYHLIMPLSAFVTAFCFVLTFSSVGGTAFEQCLIFFGALVFCSALACYRYCSFSVRVRLDGSNFGVSAEGKALTALGALAALGCICGFYAYDPDTVFINTAYVLAALCSILAIVQYLTTYYAVPKFSGSSNITVGHAFRTVYRGLDVKTFFSAVCAVGACMTVIGLSAYFCIARGLPAYAAIVAAASAAIGYAVLSAFGRLMGRTGLAVVSFVLDIAAVVGSIVTSNVGMVAPAAIATIAVSCLFVGGALSAAVAVKRRLFVAVKPNNTVGTAFILSGLADFGGCAIAAPIASAAVGLTACAAIPASYAFTACYCLSAAIAVIGFVLTVLGMKSNIYSEETLPKDGGVRDDSVRA